MGVTHIGHALDQLGCMLYWIDGGNLDTAAACHRSALFAADKAIEEARQLSACCRILDAEPGRHLDTHVRARMAGRLVRLALVGEVPPDRVLNLIAGMLGARLVDLGVLQGGPRGQA